MDAPAAQHWVLLKHEDAFIWSRSSGSRVGPRRRKWRHDVLSTDQVTWMEAQMLSFGETSNVQRSTSNVQ